VGTEDAGVFGGEVLEDEDTHGLSVSGGKS